MEKINYVYITTNLVNGKQYIGDHTINIQEKKYYLGSGDIFLKAVKKYKTKNFFKEILEWFETREEAFNAQERYIKQFNTLTPRGYNISPKGGLHIKGCHSKETKQKIGKSNKGKIISKESRIKMSISAKNRSKTCNQKNFSEKEKEYIIKRHIEENISYGKISTELGIHKDRIKRFLIKNNLYKGPLGMSQESKNKLSRERKGIKRSDETIQNISNSLIGKVPWNKGLKIK